MKRERCPGCRKMQPNVGPWKGRCGQPTRLCGTCKVRITLATPGVKERLERDVREFALALLTPPKGDA